MEEMAKYKNQKDVTIDKPESYMCFAIYGKEEIGEACKVLNGAGFKVWCYLLSNKAKEKWSISPADAYYKWGIPRTTFSDGIKELRNKGFLDDEAIHSVSSKREEKQNDEIRQKDPKSVNDKYEIRQNFDEIWGSNNISQKKTTNNIKPNNVPTHSGRNKFSFLDDDGFEF